MNAKKTDSSYIAWFKRNLNTILAIVPLCVSAFLFYGAFSKDAGAENERMKQLEVISGKTEDRLNAIDLKFDGHQKVEGDFKQEMVKVLYEIKNAVDTVKKAQLENQNCNERMFKRMIEATDKNKKDLQRSFEDIFNKNQIIDEHIRPAIRPRNGKDIIDSLNKTGTFILCFSKSLVSY